MDHTCPGCGTRVAPDARACPGCGRARNVPVFDSDGTFLGSTFAGASQSGVPASPASVPHPAPAPARLPPRFAVAVGVVLTLAVVLGVVVAYGIRAGAGPVLNAPPPQATIAPSAPLGSPDPVGSPDPLETPELPPTGPFADAARVAASGTHRLLAVTCTGTGVGTAFQFEGLLVTSVRAVSGARSITVLSGDRIVPATIAKIDARSGLALLEPADPLPGHLFELGTRQLAVGDEAALLGWTTDAQQPARGRARVAVGTITESGLTLGSPDGNHTGLRRLSGTFDPGLAGSPVIGSDGRLLGAVVQARDDQDELLVAGLDTIADPLLGPSGTSPATEPCPDAAGPQLATTVGGTAPTATRTQLGQWFDALNAGDWDRARGALAENLAGEWTREKLEADHRGSYAFNIVVTPAGQPGATVTWVRMDADGEQRCSRLTARVTVDQSGLQSLAPRGGPAPCL